VKNIKYFVILGISILFLGCSSDIDKVKDGVISQYSDSVTVGNVFDAWAKTEECVNTSWEELTTPQKAKYVQFTCQLDVKKYKTKEVMATNEQTLTAAKENLAKAKAKIKARDGYVDKFDNELLEPKRLVLVQLDRLYTKKLSSMKIVVQFSIAVNGKSFIPKFQGAIIHIDGEKEDSFYISSLLEKMYKNEKVNGNGLFWNYLRGTGRIPW
jgi:hypothetical protein